MAEVANTHIVHIRLEVLIGACTKRAIKHTDYHLILLKHWKIALFIPLPHTFCSIYPPMKENENKNGQGIRTRDKRI